MGFFEPPPVPAGENPFPALIAALDRHAYSRPSPGFDARIIVLLVITAFSMAGCVVLLVLYWMSHRRTPNAGEMWWMFRKVKRGEGTWIIINMKLLLPVKGITDLSFAAAYVVYSWAVYRHHAPQYWLGGLRVALTAPFLLGGWVLSFGSISAYLIMPHAFRPKFLTPLLINAFYVGLGIPAGAAHVGMIIWEGILYSRTYKMFLGAMDELDVLSADWDAGVDTSAALATFLSGNFKALGLSYNRYEIWTAASYTILLLACGAIFLINISYILLLVLVRRQIHRKMANPTADAARVEGARQVQALMRAERDLLIISLLVICLGGGGFVFTLLIAIINYFGTFFTQPWPLLELCNFIPVWGWSGISFLLKFYLIHNAWFNLPSSSHSQTPSGSEPQVAQLPSMISAMASPQMPQGAMMGPIPNLIDPEIHRIDFRNGSGIR